MNEPTILRTGDLAYCETVFSGLIPVKIIGQATFHPIAGASRDGVTVKVTATRGAYTRGQTIVFAESSIIPRSHVYTSNGHQMISGRPVKIQFN